MMGSSLLPRFCGSPVKLYSNRLQPRVGQRPTPKHGTAPSPFHFPQNHTLTAKYSASPQNTIPRNRASCPLTGKNSARTKPIIPSRLHIRSPILITIRSVTVIKAPSFSSNGRAIATAHIANSTNPADPTIAISRFVDVSSIHSFTLEYQPRKFFAIIALGFTNF